MTATTRARAAAGAVVLGVLLLLGGFAAHSEPALTSCSTLLGVSEGAAEHLGAAQQRRCAQRRDLVSGATWGVLALGGVVLLAGWTAARELAGGPYTHEPAPHQVVRGRSGK